MHFSVDARPSKSPQQAPVGPKLWISYWAGCNTGLRPESAYPADNIAPPNSHHAIGLNIAAATTDLPKDGIGLAKLNRGLAQGRWLGAGRV